MPESASDSGYRVPNSIPDGGYETPDSIFENELWALLGHEPLWLAQSLVALDDEAIAGLGPDDALSALDQVARLERWLSAMKARIVHRVGAAMSEAASSPNERLTASMNAVSETACVLKIPEGTSGFLLNESAALVEDFPASLEALASGNIHYQHAQVIIREGTGIPEQARSSYEAALLEAAPELTRPQLAVRARRLREKTHPDAHAERRAKAETERAVWLEPAADGMAYLGARLKAEHAVAMFDRLTRIARAAQFPAEGRTLAQLRADALVALVIEDSASVNGPCFDDRGRFRGIRPQVLVTVPVLSLLGSSDQPAELEGYGPIPATVARELAAGAPSLIRLLTDPIDSAVLDVGRRRYRVPRDLRTYLRVRDKTCRYPGCNSAAGTADIDHTVAWEDGGSTHPGNLACLCPKHHRMKHEAGWSVEQFRGGVLAWRSPTGRKYVTRCEPPPSAVPVLPNGPPERRSEADPPPF